jgi:MFS family permease
MKSDQVKRPLSPARRPRIGVPHEEAGAGAFGRWAGIAAEFRGGWPVVAASAMGTAVSVLPSTYAISVLMIPLGKHFGWPRSGIALSATFLTLGLLVAGPVFGRIYDQLGVRRFAPWAVLLFVAALLGMTQIRGSIWVLYIGYFLLGALGAGTSYFPYSRAVSTWFDKGRGLALALTTCGPAVGGVLIPLLLPKVVEAYGWQGAYVALALAALSAFPLTLYVIRECEVGSMQRSHRPGMAPAAAFRTREFWLMGSGMFTIGLALIGTQLHFVPMLIDMGAENKFATDVLALVGLGVVVGRLFSGLLLDHFFAPVVVAGFFFVSSLGFVLFLWLGFPSAPVLALAIGIATGAESDAIAYLVGRYFGLRSFAEIMGWLYGPIVLGVGCSPLLTGALYDLSGGYSIGLIVSAALAAGAAVQFLFLGPYANDGIEGGRP